MRATSRLIRRRLILLRCPGKCRYERSSFFFAAHQPLGYATGGLGDITLTAPSPICPHGADGYMTPAVLGCPYGSITKGLPRHS